MRNALLKRKIKRRERELLLQMVLTVKHAHGPRPIASKALC